MLKSRGVIEGSEENERTNWVYSYFSSC
jgi:hypothetical protein